MTKFLLLLIRFYQVSLSPVLNGPHVCRFVPRCSEYTYQAIAKYGILRGGYLGLSRIFRCHPLHSGGLDPLPDHL